MKLLKSLGRSQWSWCFYDWANSAFATTIMAGFFPIFLKQYWAAGADVNTSTFYLGVANSLAGLLLAVSAPFLGAHADHSAKKLKWLLRFLLLGSFASGGLFFVSQGNWPLAIVFYILATLGFTGGNIFYDSLLPKLSTPKNVHLISSVGYSLGYLGGGLLFAINVFMTLKPELFGLKSAAEAVQWSFLTVALWWLLFSLPVLFFVKEPTQAKTEAWNLKLAWEHFLVTAKKLWSNTHLRMFLIAYLFYIDGLNSIVKMAVDYGLSIGFESTDLITALLITQFVGFPSAVVFGTLAQKFDPRKCILVCLAVYGVITIAAASLTEVSQFYFLAASVGLVQGGLQALSRSYYSSLVPAEEAGEYFGFFNILGRFSAVLGPLLIGLTSWLTGSSRASILVILVFFILGAILLPKNKPAN